MTTAVSMMESHLPRVSVVIPVRNEAAFIAQNLAAVLAQDYPPDRLEILVADGRSDDATRDIVLATAERVHREGRGTRIELVDNPERIMPTGTNAAIRRSTGDVIVLLGGHAQLPANYLRSCASALLESGADCTGGSIRSVGTGAVGEAIASAMSSPFGIGNSGFRTARSGGPIEVDTVPFGMYRRGVFERVGLFNPNMVRHQDYEFNYRVRQSGGRMLLIPGLQAVYHVRGSLHSLWRQYWQYGIWKGRFLRRYPDSLRLRHLIPSLFALALIATAVASLFVRPMIVLLGALVGAYLGFVVAALVSFLVAGRWRSLPVVPAVMVCLHLGYGLGVWKGLLMSRVADAPRLD
jgi:cellulose synthase/poly-beta-1,6-N-acetylglucosamine synthase-like glycosyltransferase